MTQFSVVMIGGSQDPRCSALEKALRKRADRLKESGESLEILQDVAPALQEDGRAVAVVFCRQGMPFDIIQQCRDLSMPIIPLVDDLTKFTLVAPVPVREFNGFQLPASETDAGFAADIGELAGLVLEFLGLQRTKRKIFLSYARQDGAGVAYQLREAFAARLYSVFLDTVSIRPGAVFQEDLLQELADSDVVVLLNSPSVKDRPYVQQEIAFADQAGIGGVQVVWPKVRPLREGAFFAPVQLAERDGAGANALIASLSPSELLEVVRKVADLRTELQNMREDQILRPIQEYADQNGWDIVRFAGRHIELRKGRECIRLDVALGVPTSQDIERTVTDALPCPPSGRLIYDPLGITSRQAAHLNFFRTKLGLEYLDPRAALRWTIL